jgi:hypothetical protein
MSRPRGTDCPDFISRGVGDGPYVTTSNDFTFYPKTGPDQGPFFGAFFGAQQCEAQ